MRQETVSRLRKTRHVKRSHRLSATPPDESGTRHKKVPRPAAQSARRSREKARNLSNVICIMQGDTIGPECASRLLADAWAKNRERCRHLVTTGFRSGRAAPLLGPGRDRHGLPRRTALLRQASRECAMTGSRSAGGFRSAFRFDRGLSRWLTGTQHDARSEIQAIPHHVVHVGQLTGKTPFCTKSPGFACGEFSSRTDPGSQVARSYRQSERT